MQDAVVELTRQLLDLCHQMTALIATFCLPPVKPRWGDITDAGPGVGVSSRAIVFRDAEMALFIQFRLPNPFIAPLKTLVKLSD